ncbi:DUF4856 domain-containing protein [Porifericola rhodea]|uniref:DUF4856 domain-containing protein n=1 Tax=Porifericola rhodea TaxID=930972 RepID=UPI002665FADD|nr:DUF4856 domain-containing protein [Porifericola rhodea]WKN31505.1 DUF4856 domain-containing protein [Porifericola rhodea]
MSTRNLLLALFSSALFTLVSCAEDEDNSPSVNAPASYTFERNGQSTVSFSGQTTRIKMATELVNALGNFDAATKSTLLEMYRNETPEGGDANPYQEAALNDSDKSVRSKVAASRDLFFTNTTEGTDIKNQFELWIESQVDEVFPNEEVLAKPGTAGQIADGSSTRYVSAKGLEYNQLVNKGLIGALMTDQMLNNYLSEAVLDENVNRELNESASVEEGQNYTTMEHKWDEAYGYAYGTAADPSNPNSTLSDNDIFLSKYIARVESDADFTGIADEIYDAFKLGRAAIVEHNYELRDEQANIIRKKVSEVIGIRAVYYLQQAKLKLEQDTPDYGSIFHDLSEAYGFIYSLQFTRQPNSNVPYHSGAEVNEFIEKLMNEGANGLWNVSPQTLEELSEAIASPFEFTVAEAASND